MSLAVRKNRWLAAAALALVAVGGAAYFVAPLALSPLVAWAYHSDLAPLSALMSNRAAAGLEAYQAKALSLFRDALWVVGTALLTLLWVSWEDEREGPVWRALAWPCPNARTLAILGAGFLALLSIRGQLPFLLPLVAAAITLLARPRAGAFPRFTRLMDAVLQPRVSLPLVLALLLASFLVKFPLSQFDELVFFDDYPTIYTVTLKGWEMLKQGGLFGWDPAMMGGYYTSSDVSHNEIFFMLPFLPFGPRVAFHLMILFYYMAFPVLLYGYARLLFADERAALLALWGGAFVAFGFFDNLLYWGMVNSFIGLCFLLLDLILVRLMRRGWPYASFFLILSLSLTLYAATGFFVYTLLLIGLDFLWHFDRRMIPRLAFVMAAAFVITLTFTYQPLVYADYYIQSDEIYAPVAYTIPQIIGQSIQALDRVARPGTWLLGVPVRYQGLFIVSLPIIVALAWEQVRARRLRGNAALGVVLMAAVVMLATLVVSPSVDMFVSRIRFVLPVYLVLIYSAWLGQERRLQPAAVLVVLAIILPTLPSRLWEPIPHQASLRAYNAPLLEAIEGLDSDLILLESMGGYDLATEGEGVTEFPETLTHLEPYFPFETSKRYMANNQEGYHHSVYRRNFITSGAFRGRLLTDWPREEIRAFLDQWGIKHLVLWSDIAKGYFEGDSHFARIWGDGFWAIYAYDGATPGDILAASAGGTLVPLGYFEQEVRLTGARAGELVRLRMNYFPAWRAYHAGQTVNLFDQEGLLAFEAPADGDYVVELRYPRYVGLSVLALLTIVVSFGLTRRFRGALSVPACAGEGEGSR